MTEQRKQAIVIGGGLAGCEAAWQLAQNGIAITLYEQKPVHYSPAHHRNGLAELVCSNSLKADRLASAAGLLKAEMERMGSLLIPCARKTAVPAGGALAVDRDAFSDLVTEQIRSHPLITLETATIDEIPAGNVVVATGPLTEGKLAEQIEQLCGTRLRFFDAAAPIIKYESLDAEKVFFAARYGRGTADYINCPMNQEEYEAFYEALVNAERAELHDCDKNFFRVYEGCMPIEILASRGKDTMRFGPLKPVGLTDPRTGRRPYAVIQLRRENQEGTMYNIVGFQTNLKFGEQKRKGTALSFLTDRAENAPAECGILRRLFRTLGTEQLKTLVSVTFPPLAHQLQNLFQRTPFLRNAIFHARRHFRIDGAPDKPVSLQLSELIGQRPLRYPRHLPPEGTEALWPVPDEAVQNERFPLSSEHFQSHFHLAHNLNLFHGVFSSGEKPFTV